YASRPVQLAMAAELAVTGLGVIGMLRAFRHEHERLRKLADDVADPFAEQIARTAARLGVPAEAGERAVMDWMVRRPGRWIRTFRRRSLLEEIDAFRKSGGSTALVSDYPARDKLAALGLGEAFDIVIAAGEPGGPRRLKPHPGGYLAASERLAIAPEDCLV